MSRPRNTRIPDFTAIDKKKRARTRVRVVRLETASRGLPPGDQGGCYTTPLVRRPLTILTGDKCATADSARSPIGLKSNKRAAGRSAGRVSYQRGEGDTFRVDVTAGRHCFIRMTTGSAPVGRRFTYVPSEFAPFLSRGSLICARRQCSDSRESLIAFLPSWKMACSLSRRCKNGLLLRNSWEQCVSFVTSPCAKNWRAICCRCCPGDTMQVLSGVHTRRMGGTITLVVH